jgi:hypothetical protein
MKILCWGMLAAFIQPVLYYYNELKYHYTRERVRAGDCFMLRVPTADNIADLFTKPTAGPIFRALMPHLKGLIRACAALCRRLMTTSLCQAASSNWSYSREQLRQPHPHSVTP